MSTTMSTENILSDSYCPYIVLERPVLNRPRFDEMYKSELEQEDRSLCQKLASQFTCNKKSLQNFIYTHIPCIPILSRYNLKTDLINDVIAGLVVGIVVIPQGMAYAILAEVPPVYGLYGSFFPPIVYFVFGTSRHISLGTFALASLIIGNEVQKYDCSQPSAPTTESFLTTISGIQNATDGLQVGSTSGGFTPEQMCKVNVALVLSLLGGFIQLLLGVFQLGFVSTYMSYPLTRAFTCASSLLVVGSQIKGLLQIELPRHSGPLSFFYMLYDLFPRLPEANVPTVIVSAVSIFVLAVTKEHIEPRFRKKFKVPFPIELLLVVIATAASYAWKFMDVYDVDIVGEVPTGIPAPAVPDFSGINIPALLPGALSAGIVGYANAMSYGKMVAKTKGYALDGNQELIAHGFTNIVGSFFNSILSSATLSRSSLAVASGATTQIFSMVACVVLLFVMLFLGHLFNTLPSCVLSAIIVVALKNLLLQIRDLKTLWSIDKVDFIIWVFTFLITIFLDVALGLFASILFVLMTIVYRAQKPPSSLLGHVPETELYVDVKQNNKAKEITGVKIFRFDSSLHFANTEQFTERLYAKSGLNPQRVQRQRERIDKLQRKISSFENAENVKHNEMDNIVQNKHKHKLSTIVEAEDQLTHTLILDCSVMGYIDSVGAGILAEVVKEYEKLDLRVYLAGCKENILRTLESAGFHNTAERKVVYLSVHDAVMDALATNWDNDAEGKTSRVVYAWDGERMRPNIKHDLPRAGEAETVRTKAAAFRRLASVEAPNQENVNELFRMLREDGPKADHTIISL